MPVEVRGRDTVPAERCASHGRQERCQMWPHFARQRRLDIHLLRIGEESKKLIVLLLGKGIVLVIVALRAPHGEAEIRRPERLSPVYQLLIAELFDVDSVLSVCTALRWKPVATLCSTVALGSRSPAICSKRNSSNGISRFSASITQWR